ncbi:Hypothetical protein LUCI_3257 [Lucifera butyrica]|uniref:Uncharacterized protein n=1 Tax=Lucifera butyrica TaxID=1351585 RepID=A0A498RCY5_9FIRM|nr:hypothetical protein [Lucifera butyrica]VBB07992.1 Hypothetical protein LUCI_3257 [Lucifera butyrica]
MITSVSLRRIIKRSQLYLKVMVLVLLVLYVLPKLLTLFWYPALEEKLRQEQLLERPLRVQLMNDHVS